MCVNTYFRGDIDVNGNGRDTYKFRAIHPVVMPKTKYECVNMRKSYRFFDSFDQEIGLCRFTLKL